LRGAAVIVAVIAATTATLPGAAAERRKTE